MLFEKITRQKHRITAGKIRDNLRKLRCIRNKIAHHERIIFRRDLDLNEYVDSVANILTWLTGASLSVVASVVDGGMGLAGGSFFPAGIAVVFVDLGIGWGWMVRAVLFFWVFGITASFSVRCQNNSGASTATSPESYPSQAANSGGEPIPTAMLAKKQKSSQKGVAPLIPMRASNSSFEEYQQSSGVITADGGTKQLHDRTIMGSRRRLRERLKNI